MFFRRFFSLLVFLVSILSLHAQKSNMKFGDIDTSVFSIKDYKGDSTVAAIVLGEYSSVKGGVYSGSTRYSTSSAFGVSRNYISEDYSGAQSIYHVRILIVNSDGFYEAERKIYHLQNSFLRNFKASSYNLVNGEVVASPLSKDAVLTQDIDSRKSLTSFVFPNVTAGTVIEYSFLIDAASFFDIPVKNIQRRIPVVRSDYEIYMPSYCTFRHNYDFFNLKFSEDELRSTWRADSLDPIRPEIFSNNVLNYTTSIESVLNIIEYNKRKVFLYTNYNMYGKDMLDESGFGGQLISTKFIRDEIKLLQLDSLSESEKAQVIFKHIQNRMFWNKQYETHAYYKLLNSYSQNRGSSADINLLLISFLREAGLNAYPVVLGSRNSRQAFLAYPIPSRIDYVVAGLVIDGNVIFLDGTAKYASFGQLPKRSINGYGFIIYSKNVTSPIKLRTNENYSQTTFTKAMFNAENDFEADIVESYSSLSAQEKRSEIALVGGEDIYKENYSKNASGKIVSSISFQSLDDNEKPLIVKSTVIQQDGVEKYDDKIIIQPFINTEYSKPLFPTLERKLPIDFVCPKTHKFIYMLTIPEGYAIESLPEVKRVELVNSASSFMYNVMQKGSMLQIVVDVAINQEFYLATDISSLKSFFDTVSESLNQSIVLKKNN